MKLPRLPHDPGALADFYEHALGSLGALCERPWYDRMQVIAEGPAARLWNRDDSLMETELLFPSVDSTTTRDASREVFPGCPLTFQLAEVLLPSPPPLERVVLSDHEHSRPPANDVAEKLWRAQFVGTTRWRLEKPFVSDHSFSLVGLARCEIQAIDQHWSLHRVGISLLDGSRDELLAASLDFAQVAPRPDSALAWPDPDPVRWNDLLRTALEQELATTLQPIRVRQENYLRRELHRIDDYFENYAAELNARATRSDAGKTKNADRLAAAKAEHLRRRQDQIQRHEIRVLPRFDALLLVAEPAWRATVSTVANHQTRLAEALFIPRSRRWLLPAPQQGT